MATKKTTGTAPDAAAAAAVAAALAKAREEAAAAEEAAKAFGTGAAGAFKGGADEADKLAAAAKKATDALDKANKERAKGDKDAATSAAKAAADLDKRLKSSADAAYMSTRKDAKAGGWSAEKEAYELAKRRREAAQKAGAKPIDVARLSQTEDKAKAALDKSNAAKSAGLNAGSMAALGTAGMVAAVGITAATAAIKVMASLASSVTGVGSMDELNRLAVGARAMSQIQGIQARTGAGFRAMFRGIDASPLVRAVDLFSRNFTGQTATGKAVGDILSRAFGGAFALIERLEPAATGAFQGMVLGSLMVENAWLRLRIAAHPITKAISDAIGPTDTLALAGDLASIAFAQVARDIDNISLGMKGAARIAAAFGLIEPEKDDPGYTAKRKKAAPEAAAEGAAVGSAMGTGIVAGLDAQEVTIFNAGKRASDAAIRGAKSGAEIRSPSRKMRREVGHQLGEGVALGEEDMEDRVQKAAASSLVPDPSKLAALGGGGRGSVTITAPLLSIGQIVVQGAEEIRAEVRRVVDDESARIAELLGLPAPARA